MGADSSRNDWNIKGCVRLASLCKRSIISDRRVPLSLTLGTKRDGENVVTWESERMKESEGRLWRRSRCIGIETHDEKCTIGLNSLCYLCFRCSSCPVCLVFPNLNFLLRRCLQVCFLPVQYSVFSTFCSWRSWTESIGESLCDGYIVRRLAYNERLVDSLSETYRYKDSNFALRSFACFCWLFILCLFVLISVGCRKSRMSQWRILTPSVKGFSYLYHLWMTLITIIRQMLCTP